MSKFVSTNVKIVLNKPAIQLLMFTRLFKEQLPIAAIFVLLIGGFLWFLGIKNPPTPLLENQMPLADLINFMVGKNAVAGVILAFLLVLSNGFLLNNLLSRYEIFPVKNYFPMLFYVLFMSSFKSLIFPAPIIFAHSFIIFGLFRIAQSNRLEEALGKIFEAGAFFSIASLFYFPAILIYPTVWVAIIVIRPFVWREWFTSILGLILPYLFAFTWYFWFDSINVFIFSKIFYPTQDFVPDPNAWSGFTTTTVSAWLLITFLSIWFLMIKGWPTNTILSKNMLVVFIWVLLLSALAFLMAPAYEIRFFSLAALPLAVLIANYFVQIKWTLFADLLLLSLITIIVIDFLNSTV